MFINQLEPSSSEVINHLGIVAGQYLFITDFMEIPDFEEDVFEFFETFWNLQIFNLLEEIFTLVSFKFLPWYFDLWI